MGAYNVGMHHDLAYASFGYSIHQEIQTELKVIPPAYVVASFFSR